jgi:hypothetical protein
MSAKSHLPMNYGRPTRNRKRNRHQTHPNARPSALPVIVPSGLPEDPAPLPSTLKSGFGYETAISLLIDKAQDPLNSSAAVASLKMLLAELKERDAAGTCPDPSAHVPRPMANAADLAETAGYLAAAGGFAWTDAQWSAILRAAPAHLVTQLLLDQPTADEGEAAVTLVEEDGSEIIDVTPVVTAWGWIGNRCERQRCGHPILQHSSGLDCNAPNCGCQMAVMNRPAPQSQRAYEEGARNTAPG